MNAIKNAVRRFGGLELPHHIPDDREKLAYIDKGIASFNVRLRAIEAGIDAQARRRVDYKEG